MFSSPAKRSANLFSSCSARSLRPVFVGELRELVGVVAVVELESRVQRQAVLEDVQGLRRLLHVAQDVHVLEPVTRALGVIPGEHQQLVVSLPMGRGRVDATEVLAQSILGFVELAFLDQDVDLVLERVARLGDLVGAGPRGATPRTP